MHNKNSHIWGVIQNRSILSYISFSVLFCHTISTWYLQNLCETHRNWVPRFRRNRMTQRFLLSFLCEISRKVFFQQDAVGLCHSQNQLRGHCPASPRNVLTPEAKSIEIDLRSRAFHGRNFQISRPKPSVFSGIHTLRNLKCLRA